MTVIVLCILFVLIIAGIVLAASQGFKGGAGAQTTVVLGANDLLMSEEQRHAAEVIVEMNAGKRFEEQSSQEPKKS
jgi:hypothetical protein